jgi:hypothetical protein
MLISEAGAAMIANEASRAQHVFKLNKIGFSFSSGSQKFKFLLDNHKYKINLP